MENEKNPLKTKREVIKSFAILFLIIMLLLTFFSNTIMNYSLPQVKTEYTYSGELDEQIRGEVIVNAASSKEVKINETRTISDILVYSGDKVEKGDVLITLIDGDSAELTTAKTELVTLKVAYSSFLKENKNDYTLKLLEIANDEEDLQALKDELEVYLMVASNDGVTKADIIKAEAEKAKFEKALAEYGEVKADLDEKKSELSAYITAISAGDYKGLSEEIAAELVKLGDKVDVSTENLNTHKEKLDAASGGDTSAVQTEINEKKKQISDAEFELIKANETLAATDSSDNEAFKTAIEAVTAAKNKIASYKDELDVLESKYNAAVNGQTELTMLKNNYENAKNVLEFNEKNLKAAVNKYTSTFQKQVDAYEKSIKEVDIQIENVNNDIKKQDEIINSSNDALTLIDQIETDERALEIKKINFEQEKNDDTLNSELVQLQLETKQAEIAAKEKEIEKLEDSATDGKIIAETSGIIENINCVVGEKVESGTALMEISLSEKGYLAELSVTLEQAKKVRVGEDATIKYNWGGDVYATLIKIESNKEQPSNKTLVFNVTGDVWSGKRIDISVGSGGKRYETVVPNSAIREDNNGKYVLKVISKSSPLGNRYIAERVDVQVEASDEKNSAVVGELVRNDYIISTATAPISSGEMVRLIEE